MSQTPESEAEKSNPPAVNPSAAEPVEPSAKLPAALSDTLRKAGYNPEDPKLSHALELTILSISGIAMSEERWSAAAKGLLKAELKRRNMTYEDLARKLTDAGHPENARNLTNKVARGTFTAAFLLECLSVIGCTSVRIDDLAAIESA